VGTVIFIMFQRVALLRVLLYFGPERLLGPLRARLLAVRKTQTAFFCKKADLYVMNKAVLYVHRCAAPLCVDSMAYACACVRAFLCVELGSDKIGMCMLPYTHASQRLIRRRSNEATADSVLVVHCYDKEPGLPAEFPKCVETIDRMYPSIRVSLLCVSAPFSPALVDYISAELGIPKNLVRGSMPAHAPQAPLVCSTARPWAAFQIHMRALI
jgi:hypothetical protein